MSKTGRPKAFTEADHPRLSDIASKNPCATLVELTAIIEKELDRSAHFSTVRKALNEAGVRRVKPVLEKSEEVTPPRYGYTDKHRAHAQEQRYSSCLTDEEWALVSDIFENEGRRGAPPTQSRRTMVDACCYVVKTGCSWRMLPNDFPHWDNVYKTFRRWGAEGKFEEMHDRLRAQWRQREGRQSGPSAAVIDAQSTRISPQGGVSGYDAGKKVKGRKRNLVVDTLGLLLAVTVTSAAMQDRDAAHDAVAIAQQKYPSIKKLYVDGGYAGQCAQRLRDEHALDVEVVRHPANKNGGRWQASGQGDFFPVQVRADGFKILPKRWVVERSHAWNERARRLVMHHDRLIETATTWVWLANARYLLRRLVN